MLFKNLQLFRMTGAPFKDGTTLENHLKNHQAHPCGKTQGYSLGWTSPFGGDNPVLVHGIGHYLLFCLRKEERLLPTTVVNETLAQRVNDLQNQEQRQLSAKERRRLKEDIIFELRPQAFTRGKLTFAYMDTNKHFLIIDTPSRPQGEEFTRFLRSSLGTLTLAPLTLKRDPCATMTQWLVDKDLPPQFDPTDRCECANVHQGTGMI